MKAKVVGDLYQRSGICIWQWNGCCSLGRARLLKDLSCADGCCLQSSYVSVFLGNSPLAGELFLNHVEWEDMCSLAAINGGKECCYFFSPFASCTLPFCLELNSILTSEIVLEESSERLWCDYT